MEIKGEGGSGGSRNSTSSAFEPQVPSAQGHIDQAPLAFPFTCPKIQPGNEVAYIQVLFPESRTQQKYACHQIQGHPVPEGWEVRAGEP